MRILLIIGAGGFLGSAARYMAQQAISKVWPVIFPLGTFTVNIVGCFLVGVIYALAERSTAITPEWRFFLATGFCGGFTTFSTFSYEAYNLIREGQYIYLSLYLTTSVIVGIFSTILAIALIRSL